MAKTKNPALEERRRAQVIETVQRLMTESSYKTMTMDMVAQEAGVSKGLINYYFKSKDDLIIQTIRAYHAREGQALAKVMDATDVPARERLKAIIETVFPSRPAVEAEVRFQTEVRSYAKTNPEVWKQVGESYREFRVACEELLKRGIEEGYVKRKMGPDDIRWTYLIFHSTVTGLLYQFALDKSLKIKELQERLLAHLDRMLA